MHQAQCGGDQPGLRQVRPEDPCALPGWTATSTLLPLLPALGIWAVFAVAEGRALNPLLNVALLARRPTLGGSFLMLIATGPMVGGFFLGSFALQHADGYSAWHVGLAFLPMAIATIAGAQTATQALARVNARTVAIAGLTLAAGGYAIAAEWKQSVTLITGLSVATLGIGATFVTAFTAALSDVPSAEGGLRFALVSTFHELGGATGVAVLSSVAGAGLIAANVSTHDFSRAFTVGAAIAAVAVAIAAVVVPKVVRTTTP